MHNIIYEYQFGFRPQHSTTLSLIEIVDYIRNNLDKGNYVLGIFMDLSKAFDMVNHKILLDKMEHYGVRGIALKWFQSYLSGRSQYTHVNDINSSRQEVTVGVPQGSVLGPLLFLLYINDFHKATSAIENVQPRLFADDSNVFITEKNPNTLKVKAQMVLKEILKWFRANKLCVNIGKTCYSIFANKNKNIPATLNTLKADNMTIDRTNVSKYLGLHMDDGLTWETHINNINNDLVKITNAFKIIKNKVTHNNKRKMFFAYFQSKAQYGIEIYGHAGSTIIKKLQTQQNKSIKILYNLHPRTSTNKIHLKNRFLKIKDLHKSFTLNFLHKYKNNQLPPIFNDMFTQYTDIHTHQTRNRENYHRPPIRLATADKSMQAFASKLWNKLPRELKETTSYTTFKTKVKEFLRKDYEGEDI